jgi:hypothetical protein
MPREKCRTILPGIYCRGRDNRISRGFYDPDAEGDAGTGDAEDPLSDGWGEAAGVAVAVPVTSAGMGMVCGIMGAEVRGWIGMGEV